MTSLIRWIGRTVTVGLAGVAALGLQRDPARVWAAEPATITMPEAAGCMTNLLSLDVVNFQECYREGDTICVELNMSNLTQFVTGFQAFLAYDDGPLTFQPGASSYTAAPFSQHIQAMGSAEVSPGEINLDGSDVIFGPGTDQDALLATLCFVVDPGNDGTAFNFRFRTSGSFSSELSFQGNAVATCLRDSAAAAVDQSAPDLTCPADATVGCDSAVPPPDFSGGSVFDDCDSDPDLNHVGDVSSGACPRTITRTYSASDSAGNETTCVQTITVDDSDATPPTITCPPTLDLQCTDTIPPAASDLAEFMAIGGSAADNCGTVAVTMIEEDQAGQPCTGGRLLIVRVYEAEDPCGNTSRCKHVIRVRDDTAPAITCPSDASVDCDAPPDAVQPANTGTATALDNCDTNASIDYSDSSTAGVCPQEYTITRTWTATDDCGNVSSCDQVISVVDLAAPAITCPGNDVVECSEPSGATDPSFTGTASAIDNCDTNGLDVGYADATSDGDCPQEYVITRTWSATDDCGNGNSCVQTISVVDTVDPVITCPADVTVECDESTDPSNTGAATAMDACDTNGMTINYADVTSNGDCLPEYVIVRTWTATDDCGNESSCVQTITVQDTTPPMLTCPADVTVECDDPTDPGSTGSAGAVDNCDGSPAVSYADVTANGDCAQEHVITRTWTATDSCGNSVSCDQTISVEDTTPPVFLFCPPPVTVECDDPLLPGSLLGISSGGVAIYYNNNGGGEHPANQAYLRSQVSYGNTHGAVFNFNPLGGYGPGHPFQAIPHQFGLDMVLPAPTYDGSVAIPVLSAVDNVNGTIGGATVAGPVTWAINDYQGHPGTSAGYLNSLMRSGSPPALGDVIVTQNDVSQSGTVFTAAIAGHLVTDGKVHWHNPLAGQNPDFTTNLSCLGLGDSFYFTGTLSYDSAGDPGTDLIDFYSGSTVLVAKPVGAGSLDVPNVALGMPIAVDNCDPCISISYADVTTNGGCAGEYVITRTWTATDACGNAATCNQTITVVDTTAPMITCPADINTNADAGGCDAVVTFASPTTVDNCDAAPAVVCTPASGSTFPVGTTTVSCTTTDDCGNASQCEFDVTVNSVNEINVEVELVGVNLPSSRCIHFAAGPCSNDGDFTLSFGDHDGDDVNQNGVVDSTEGGSDTPSTPVRATAQIELACGSWSSVCAKDEQHTLFDTVALGDLGDEYSAPLLSLEGGDTDNNGRVDINDVTYLLLTFGGAEPAGGCPWNGARGADFSNNGNTGVEDYTFLTSNWLRNSACGCSARTGGAPSGPGLVSLPLAGWAPEIAARIDLVRDGIVDHRDVAAFERRHGLPGTLSVRIRASAVTRSE